MKRSTVATFLFALATITLTARAQSDAMPPEQTAPAHAAAKSTPAMEHGEPAVTASKFLAVTFEGRTINLTLTDLANMPMTTVHVHNAHSNIDETYAGPLVSEVLAKAGFVSTAETHALVLHSTVIATGTDHYFVLYSGAEVQPSFSTAQVIVAVMKSGLPDKDGGLIQLVNTADTKPARWVHGLASLSVMSVAQNK